MQQEAEVDRRLPAQRAFVVQLLATAEVTPGRLTGRVEHVVSGQAIQFHSLDDLLAFMAQVLATQRVAPDC
jgi:hypothetical protein